jgi:hypothetical protein
MPPQAQRGQLGAAEALGAASGGPAGVPARPRPLSPLDNETVAAAAGMMALAAGMGSGREAAAAAAGTEAPAGAAQRVQQQAPAPPAADGFPSPTLLSPQHTGPHGTEAPPLQQQHQQHQQQLLLLPPSLLYPLQGSFSFGSGRGSPHDVGATTPCMDPPGPAASCEHAVLPPPSQEPGATATGTPR